MTNQPMSDADRQARMIMLVYGKMEDGSPYWCYVAVKPSEYDRFTTLWRKGGLNMQHFEKAGFGEVIVSGTGVIPPADVTRQVAAMFGARIQDLFGDVEPKSLISQAIEKLKNNSAQS